MHYLVKTSNAFNNALQLIRSSMWKVNLTHSVSQLRFVVKNTREHHGTWKFIDKRWSELRMLNRNTFFALAELSEEFKTESRVHLVYGDLDNTQDHIDTAGISCEELERILKEKIAYGLTLRRAPICDDSERDTPIDIVEAQKYTKWFDDGF